MEDGERKIEVKGLLLGLVLLLPFHLLLKRLLPEPLGTVWKEVVVSLLLVAALAEWIRQRSWSPSPLDGPVLAVLAVLGLRFLLQVLPALRDGRASDVRLAAWGLYTLARYVPVYFIVVSLVHDGHGLRPYLIAMLAAGAFCGLAAALEFGLDRHWIVSQDIRRTYSRYDLYIYGTQVRRAYATFDFPPALGGYLASLLPLTVAMIPVARPGWQRGGLIVILGLLATGLAFTFSRGPWLASLAGLGVLGVLWVGLDRDRWRAIYLAGVLIALAVLFWLIGAVAAARAPADMGNVVLAQLRSAAQWDDPTNIPRTEAWRRALTEWGHRPWLGLGLGRTGDPAVRFLPAGQGYATESMVLKLGVETGMVGLLAYLTVAGVAAWIGLRSYHRLKNRLDRAVVAGLLAGLAVIATHGLIYQVLEIKQIDLVTWFFLGGLSVMARSSSQPKTSEVSKPMATF
jgi:hypothetical protein